MRRALDGVTGLFLLSAVTADELTGTLIALDLARRAGVRDLVYLSVIHADRFTHPPHFAAKGAAERMITDQEFAATVLRPGYYMQNDTREKDRILDGRYVIPLGPRGVYTIDVDDLALAGVNALLERQSQDQPAPAETIDVITDELLTGPDVAAIWTDVLQKPVTYGGDDLDALERLFGGSSPDWRAYDMRLMMQAFQDHGMTTPPTTADRLSRLLGRPPRTYEDFARDVAMSWDA